MWPKPGEWLHYEIYYKNISETELYNLVMVDNLEGGMYDFSTIRSDTGTFRQGDSSIVFDWKQNDKLTYLAPMDEGKVEFWIRLKDDLSSLSQPELDNKVMIGAAREDFITKISSKLEIAQKAYYNDEIFGNSGPFPPKVGKKTTYTVTWQAKNYYSDVKNVKVIATLPPEVAFDKNNVFPEDQAQKLSYDEDTRQITWTLGNMSAGQGLISNPVNVSFQVALTPMSSQRGEKAGVIGEAKIFGDDSWTNSTLESTSPAIDTATISDFGLSEEDGIVQ